GQGSPSPPPESRARGGVLFIPPVEGPCQLIGVRGVRDQKAASASKGSHRQLLLQCREHIWWHERQSQCVRFARPARFGGSQASLHKVPLAAPLRSASLRKLARRTLDRRAKNRRRCASRKG